MVGEWWGRGAMEKKKAMERQGGFRLTGYGVERQDYGVRFSEYSVRSGSDYGFDYGSGSNFDYGSGSGSD